MKRLLILLAMCMPILVSGQSRKQKKADADTQSWRYEIEYISNNANSNVTVKVWSYSKKPEIAAEQAKKNAVHGIIFKGVPARDRYVGRRALVESSAADSGHEAFFDEFFGTGGEYMRFVTLTEGRDVLKVSKKEYKVGVAATVLIDDLRQYLEGKGVVRKLGHGF